MNNDPYFGKKTLTNGEILSILIASLLIVCAFFLFINIYIIEINGAKVSDVSPDLTEVILYFTDETQKSPLPAEKKNPVPSPLSAALPSAVPTMPIPSPSDTPIPTDTPTPVPTGTQVPRQTSYPTSTPEPMSSPVAQTISPTLPPPTPFATRLPDTSAVPSDIRSPIPLQTQSPLSANTQPPDIASQQKLLPVLPIRPFEFLSSSGNATDIIKTYPSYFSSSAVRGTITYSRFHTDLGRFFVYVNGARGNADTNGAFGIDVPRTGAEDIMLGFDDRIIYKTSIFLDSVEITKDFNISSIIPGLMRRNYDPSIADKDLFASIQEMVVNRGNVALKRVALTLDDGFVQDYKLLDLLEELEVRCTVFLIGGRNVANGHPDWISRMDRMGFEVCNHSFMHTNVTLLTDTILQTVLRETQRVISNVTKKSFPYFRPPGGAYDKRTLATIARNGYMIVNWSNSTGDTVPGNKTEKQVKYVLDHLKNGDIILSHFGAYNTYDVIKSIVPEIRKRGYELVTLSEVLEGL
jgi:peptidoglycan/xylan/chitin deacetylase (PgdA/CDA1 family)